MPSFITAYEQMTERGLITAPGILCEDCGPKVILMEAKKGNKKGPGPWGFVHVGDWQDPEPPEEVRVPLRFGLVTGAEVTYRDPACLAVGDVVAECLEKEGIRYEWDRVPGQPISLVADETVTGIPTGDTPSTINLDEDYRDFRHPMFPKEAFDRLGKNPVRLLNLVQLRRRGKVPSHMRGEQGRPQVGDKVKLGFLVWDALNPEAGEGLEGQPFPYQLESMWVEVTRVRGKHPKCVYRGELVNVPVWIDPAKLRVGSPVVFKPAHVYPVERGGSRPTRR